MEQSQKTSEPYNNIQITNEWDKTFKKSDKVNHKKVTFHNRFGVILVGDLYEPKERSPMENYQLLQFVVLSVQLRNKPQDYMLKIWQKEDS